MLKIGVVGIGGYASHVCQGLLEAADDSERVQFVAACDPQMDDQPKHRDLLLQTGIPILKHFDQLLELKIDAVWLPIPIDLHKPFTERALSAGKAVIVEKPAAGTVDEVDSMIAARDRSGLPVAVGFQNLFDPNTWAVKQRLLDGLIGEIRSASVIGCWPRTETYYSRAAWAGRASRDGAWVLDSPMNNAMAHFVNLALFLLGDTPAVSAVPASVEAELFRAYSIEMFDTCSVRAKLTSGASLMVAMTHACRETTEPVVTLHGTRGAVRFLHEGNRFEVSNAEGKVVQTLCSELNPIRQIIRQFGRSLAGDDQAHVASLENARSHTLLVNAVSEAATISDVPLTKIELIPTGSNGQSRRAIRGIENLLHDSVRQGQLASKIPASSLIARRACFDLGDYRSFAGPRLELRPDVDVSHFSSSLQ